MGDEMANEWLAGGEGGRLWHRRLMKSGAFVFLRRNFRVSFKQFLIHFCASNRHTGLEPVAKKKEEDQKFSTQHLQWLYPIHYFTHSTTHHHTPVSASSSGRSPISVVLPRRKFMLYDNMSYVANVPSSFIRFGWWMVMLCHCLPCLSCCMPIP